MEGGQRAAVELGAAVLGALAEDAGRRRAPTEVSSPDLSQTDRKPFVWAGALGGRLLFYFKDIDSTQAQGVILLPSAEPPSGRGTWADSKRPAHTARLAKKKRDIDRSKYKADYLCCKMVCSEIKEVKGGQMVLQDRELILGSKQADEDNFREWEDLLVPDLKEPPPLIAGVRLPLISISSG